MSCTRHKKTRRLLSVPFAQARDKNRLDRLEGGDDVTTYLVPVEPATRAESQHHEGYAGTIVDNEDGTYDVSYNAELAG